MWHFEDRPAVSFRFSINVLIFQKLTLEKESSSPVKMNLFEFSKRVFSKYLNTVFH